MSAVDRASGDSVPVTWEEAREVPEVNVPSGAMRINSQTHPDFAPFAAAQAVKLLGASLRNISSRIFESSRGVEKAESSAVVEHSEDVEK